MIDAELVVWFATLALVLTAIGAAAWGAWQFILGADCTRTDSGPRIGHASTKDAR